MPSAKVLYSNTLGEYLRKLRERKGLPIRKVAIAIDRTDAYVNRLELGKRHTDLRSLYLLIKVLDGDFLYALSCLCRDEGVPEEVAAAVAGESRSISDR